MTGRKKKLTTSIWGTYKAVADDDDDDWLRLFPVLPTSREESTTLPISLWNLLLLVVLLDFSRQIIHVCYYASNNGFSATHSWNHPRLRLCCNALELSCWPFVVTNVVAAVPDLNECMTLSDDDLGITRELVVEEVPAITAARWRDGSRPWHHHRRCCCCWFAV